MPTEKPTPEMVAKALAKQTELNNRRRAEEADEELESTRSASPTPLSYTLASTTPTSHGNIPPDILRIIKAYEEHYGKNPEQNKEGQYIFIFNTLEDARGFFKTQASQNLSFMMVEAGKGFSGHNFFSCGDGRLYEGSLNNIKAGLVSALKETPNNPKTQEGLQRITTYLAREALNEHRTPEPTPSPQAATPCPTTPKPRSHL
jgi:hypothetical protein